MIHSSVIIPVRNGAATIAAQLDALTRQTDMEFELIIADNGSTDGTYDVVARTAGSFARVEFVNASDVSGAAAARNIGAAAATTDRLLFCDADDLVGPNWVAAHRATLERVAASTGPLSYLKPSMKKSVDLSLAATTRLPRFVDRVPFALAGNLGVQATVFSELRGFDITLKYCEDTEFCIRLHRDGHDLGWNPDARLFIRERNESAASCRRYTNWGRGTVEVFRRHRDYLGGTPSLSTLAKPYGRLVADLPKLADTQQRVEWLKEAARCAGRLDGSLRNQVFLP